MASPRLSVEYLPLASLHIDSQNPRVHSRKQIQQLANSIQKFGFSVPVLVDSQLRVLAGHGRVSACQLLGISDIPIIRLDNLTEDQARAFTIADNRLAERSAWDHRLLGEQLKILSEAQIDFSLEITGFEMGEIDLIIEGAARKTTDEEDSDELTPNSGAKCLVTRPRDCWSLGRHRVYCGDGQSESVYVDLMQGCRAGMVFTTPLYAYPSNRDPIRYGPRHCPEPAVASSETRTSAPIDFLKDVVTQLSRYSIDGALHYFCMDWLHSADMFEIGASFYKQIVNLCVWVKEGSCGGPLYRSQHELIFVFRFGEKEYCKKIHAGKIRRRRTDVWKYADVSSRPRAKDDRSVSRRDSANKPVELVADAILDCTTRGGSVLDPFLRSGSTLFAAERTGRVCFGLEPDPRNVDAIVRRWQSITGKSAILDSSGRSFDDIEKGNNGR